MISVAVIGGGASGMAFAVALKQKRPDIEVAVFEKNPKVLKKILVTGNGRCNILNFDVVAENYFEACEFVRPAVEKYTPKKTEAIFRDMGLLLMSGGQSIPDFTDCRLGGVCAFICCRKSRCKGVYRHTCQKH